MFLVCAMESLSMPKKKSARELTDEEALKRLFPKKVRDKLKEVAHENDQKEDSETRKPNKQRG